jgi:Carbamoyltransferase C-terminus
MDGIELSSRKTGGSLNHENPDREEVIDGSSNRSFGLVYAAVSAFEQATGCPALGNTSFNVRGEPIVGTPEDALRCFMGAEPDMLAVGNCLLRKEQQDPALKKSYESAFELD